MSQDELHGGNPEGHENNEESTDDTKMSKNRYKILFNSLKILAVIAIFAVAFYFIYFKTTSSRAYFILSNNDIKSIEKTGTVISFNKGQRIFFLVKGKKETINALNVVIKIDRYRGKVYSKYKQITFETDKRFPQLRGIIPGVYFLTSGKYKIEAYMDGNLIGSRKITVR